MFLVPLEHPGVEVQGIATLGGERTNFIYFDEARVPDWYRLGPINQGWQVASGALADEHGMGGGHTDADGLDASSAELIDALGKSRGWHDEFPAILAAGEAWARTARRPDGSAAIDDPAVRLRLARIALDCEVADVTPEPYGRVIASDLLIRDTAELIALAGPVGLLTAGEEGAAAGGVLEWAHRFAQGTSIYGGTTDIQTEPHRGTRARASEASWVFSSAERTGVADDCPQRGSPGTGTSVSSMTAPSVAAGSSATRPGRHPPPRRRSTSGAPRRPTDPRRESTTSAAAARSRADRARAGCRCRTARQVRRSSRSRRT